MLVWLHERISSKSCFGWDLELTSRVQIYFAAPLPWDDSKFRDSVNCRGFQLPRTQLPSKYWFTVPCKQLPSKYRTTIIVKTAVTGTKHFFKPPQPCRANVDLPSSVQTSPCFWLTAVPFNKKIVIYRCSTEDNYSRGPDVAIHSVDILTTAMQGTPAKPT